LAAAVDSNLLANSFRIAVDNLICIVPIYAQLMDNWTAAIAAAAAAAAATGQAVMG